MYHFYKKIISKLSPEKYVKSIKILKLSYQCFLNSRKNVFDFWIPIPIATITGGQKRNIGSIWHSKYLFTSTKKTTKKVRNLLKQTKNAYRKLSHIGFLKILETQRFRVKKVVNVEHTKFHALLNDWNVLFNIRCKRWCFMNL